MNSFNKNHKTSKMSSTKCPQSNRQAKLKKQTNIQDTINREKLQEEFAKNYYMLDPLDKNLYRLLGVSEFE